ncbi:hypothetical protein Thiosp_04003 [Thiorhodovibrio litoralis]|nr:hypothetical protein Thiosp_04003 [Thiorhodovibrio litoralis]
MDRITYRIENDPYELRNGSRLVGFSEPRDLELALYSRFMNIRLGTQDDDFYGIRVAGYFGFAEKRNLKLQPSHLISR